MPCPLKPTSPYVVSKHRPPRRLLLSSSWILVSYQPHTVTSRQMHRQSVLQTVRPDVTVRQSVLTSLSGSPSERHSQAVRSLSRPLPSPLRPIHWARVMRGRVPHNDRALCAPTGDVCRTATRADMCTNSGPMARDRSVDTRGACQGR